MGTLTLGDVKLVIEDLFRRRQEAFGLLHCATTYGPLLTAKLEAIDALPEALIGGRAYATELSDVDARHDGLGTAIRLQCEALLAHPDAPADLRATAARVRDTFAPSALELRDSYGDEAARARDRRPLLAEREADLRALPVPVAGTSLYDWVAAQLETGGRLGELLSARADATPAKRAEAAILRPTTLSLLTRFRQAVADELAARPELPRDLDQRLFAFLDERTATREAQGSAAAPPAPPTPVDA